ncbi:MAG: CopG family transcriptional regulator [Candidatus Nezhaarchaeota archaeon]|nr:CopG family transcriptional regulator [Candidatus Nezhaarchaeota archaeon]MCX8142548.1 CopG family transcriptional regulator [Candidatus Nezhaarchaeota archaeon]
MSDVLSIRIPRDLKKSLEELKDVDWRGEIISFLNSRIEYYRRLKALAEARKVIEKLPEAPRGTTFSYVREDRDSH